MILRIEYKIAGIYELVTFKCYDMKSMFKFQTYSFLCQNIFFNHSSMRKFTSEAEFYVFPITL